MKRAFAFLFSLMIFISGSKNLLFVVDYHVNRNYYESVCENQNRPEMQCHGKCRLTKESQKTNNSLHLSNFAFDFFTPPTPVIPERAPMHLVNADHFSVSDASFWSEITIGVPNPPPNI